MSGDYSSEHRGCRVKGCQRPAEVVVGARVRFPSADDGDARGRASVNVSLVFCRPHAADAIQGIRDREATIGARPLDGAGVRRFEKYLERADRPEGGHDAA